MISATANELLELMIQRLLTAWEESRDENTVHRVLIKKMKNNTVIIKTNKQTKNMHPLFSTNYTGT